MEEFLSEHGQTLISGIISVLLIILILAAMAAVGNGWIRDKFCYWKVIYAHSNEIEDKEIKDEKIEDVIS